MELTLIMRCMILLVVSCALLTAPVSARPPHRQKRVSDQRLAELETLLALAKMKNRKYVTLPVGYGLIDVQQIGRRKRSMGLVDVGTHNLQQEASQQQQQIGPNHQLVRDPSAAEYDLSEIISDLSSNLPYSSSSESLKDIPTILDGSYADEEDPILMDDSGKVKDEYFVGGLRPARRPFYLGMRVAGPHHQRLY